MARFAGGGEATRAGAEFARMIARDPRNAAAWQGLGRSCMALGRYPDAARAFRCQLTLAPADAAAWAALGEALFMARDAAGALAAYRTPAPNALPLPGLLGLGHALRALGHVDEAALAYREVLAVAPDNAAAWWSLANIKAHMMTDDELAKLREAADGPRASAGLFYALGRALDDRGAFDAAFAAYAKGAAFWRTHHPYDAARDIALARKLAAVAADHVEQRHAPLDAALPAPIFIVGMPRSGSTLLEHILAASPAVAAADEPPFLAQAVAALGAYPQSLSTSSPEALAGAATVYLERLATLGHGRPVVVDKNPNNLWFVPFIMVALPAAQIIDMRREAMDACCAAYTQLFPAGFDFSYALSDLAAYRMAYVSLMDGWRHKRPERIALASYEALVRDPRAEAARLFAHCGVAWNDSFLDPEHRAGPVHTASAEQVRRPISTSSIGRWQRFARQVAPLEELLSQNK